MVSADQTAHHVGELARPVAIRATTILHLSSLAEMALRRPHPSLDESKTRGGVGSSAIPPMRSTTRDVTLEGESARVATHPEAMDAREDQEEASASPTPTFYRF